MGISLVIGQNLPIFIFNVYMPSTSHSLDDYKEMIDILANTYEYYNNRGTVIICGDMNGEMGNAAGPCINNQEVCLEAAIL